MAGESIQGCLKANFSCNENQEPQIFFIILNIFIQILIEKIILESVIQQKTGGTQRKVNLGGKVQRAGPCFVGASRC